MALTKRGARRRRHARRPIPTTPIRIIVVGAMCVVLAVIASEAFDELVWALLVPPPLITAACLASYRRPLLVRYAVLGATVLISTAIAGLIAGAGLTEVLAGPFVGLKRLLTTEWPSPRDPRIIVALALLVATLTAVAVELAGRPRLHLAPLIAIAVGLAGAMAVAAPIRPGPLTLAALAVGALLVLVFRPGEDARARVRTVAGDRALVVAIVAMVVAGAVTAAVLVWTGRADPRVTNDPEATETLLDPVEETVALREVDPAISMFEVTDRSTLIGPSLPARWRMSALDVYDGQRWTPGLTLRPIGGQLGQPSPPSPDVAPPIQFDVELLTDDFDLVPIPGRPLDVDTDSAMGVETDLGRTVVRLTEDPRPGLTISATAEIAPGTAAAQAAAIGTRQVDEISAGFTDLARSMAGDGTILEQLQAIEDTMHDTWRLDRNAPGGGQQLALIDRFVSDTNQGTEEQFVTGFVLLARSLGVEARVATGFVVPPGELGAPLGLRSTHAAVWPEVELEGLGWLAFDPVPAQETSDIETLPPPPAAQSPAAAQPPIAPPAEPANDDDTVTLDQETDIGNWERVQTWLTRGGVVGGAALLPIVSVIGLILGAKWRRRRRRLKDPDPARRISGAWANTTDSLVDAGLTIAPAWTNERIAEQSTAIAPTVPHEMQRLGDDGDGDHVRSCRRELGSRRRRGGGVARRRRFDPRRSHVLATDPLASQPALAASLDALAGHRLTFRIRAAGRATGA